jgi:hypothetical protein
MGIVGLAGLSSMGLDVIEKIPSYKDSDVDSRYIVAQSEADKRLASELLATPGYSEFVPRKGLAHYAKKNSCVGFKLHLCPKVFSPAASPVSTILRLSPAIGKLHQAISLNVPGPVSILKPPKRLAALGSPRVFIPTLPLRAW